MSNTHFAQLWLDARKDLEKLIEMDRDVQDGKPIESVEVAANKVLELYYRYRRIVRRLTECHDQLVQPQIRELVGRMLDYSIVRMLEYRREVVDLVFLEYPWPNDKLVELKLTPDDVDLAAPVYDSWANRAEFERTRRAAQELIEQADDASSSITSDATPPPTQMSLRESESSSLVAASSFATSRRTRAPSEAVADEETLIESPEERAERAEREALTARIVLIQSHERARVGRNVAVAAVRRREFDKKLAAGELRLASAFEKTQAARVIQRAWRGFLARRRLRQRIVQTEEAIGMIMPSWNSRHVYKRYQQNFEERLRMQVDAKERIERLAEAEKDRIWELRGPAVVEDGRDEIFEWLLTWYNEVGYFDHIPAAADGGSLLVSTGQARTPQEYLVEAASGGDKKKKKKEPPAPQEVEEEEEESKGWSMSESKALPLLVGTNDEFLERWSLRTEQILEPEGAPIVELIREQLHHELQLEMRPVADEAARPVLDKLNLALKSDLAEDKVPFALPEAQKFEAAESKTSGAPPEVPAEQVLAQLLRWNVIGEAEERKLSDWPGVPSYVVSATGHNPRLRLGDSKHAIVDYCVLPLASRAVSELAPGRVRAVCICGAPESGQLSLARAICAELKATVFDLTPERHVGRFARKDSQARLAQSVLQLAKRFAPSVVLVDGGEKAWLRKLPPEMRRVKPKRFAAIYTRIVKGIEPGDRVLFLSTSSWPHMASGPFVRLHDKFIVLPLADHSSLQLGLLRRLMACPAVDRRFDVSALARALAGRLPLEAALAGLDDCLGIRRRMRFRKRPLSREELLERLLERAIPEEGELEKLRKFGEGMPLAKRRRGFEEENKPVEEPKKK